MQAVVYVLSTRYVVGGFIFGLLVGILFRGRAEELTLETERRYRRV